MEKYKEFINMLSKNKSSKEFLNSDEQHALIVFDKLFNVAQQHIRIFAACLCGEENSYHVANDPVYISALSGFIERGGLLYITLNEFDETKVIRSDLMRRLFYYQTESEFKNNIVIKTTDIKLHYAGDEEKKGVHFTVIDNNAYRIEIDIDERAATCNFNNEKGAMPLIEKFDKIFSDAKVLDLEILFNK